jgi:hypothetical protein
MTACTAFTEEEYHENKANGTSVYRAASWMHVPHVDNFFPRFVVDKIIHEPCK